MRFALNALVMTVALALTSSAISNGRELGAESLLQNQSLPSDSQILRALSQLATIRFQQKRYQEAESLFKEALDISDKPDRPLEQDRRFGGVDEKQRWMLTLAAICLKTDRKNEAKDWIAKAKEAAHYPAVDAPYDMAVDFAFVEIVAGLSAEAAADIEVAEKEAGTKTSNAERNFQTVAELWKRNGREDRSIEALKKATAVKKERLQASSRRVSALNPPLVGPTMSSSPPDLLLRNYFGSVERAVKRTWSPPKGVSASKRVEVSFKVTRTGNISALKVDLSSGVSALDDSALDAVRRAAPFGMLPENYKDNIDVRLGFDSNEH